MNLTMLSIGSTGDVRPFILLGKELASRGHRVTIAAFPQFQQTVHHASLHFFPLDGDAEKMIGAIMKPDTNGLSYLPRLMKNIRLILPGLLRSMTESCQNADAMVCNFFGSVYYSIAEMYDIPCIQVDFFPMDQTKEIPISSIRNQRLGYGANIASYKLGYLIMSCVEKYCLSSWRKSNDLKAGKLRMHPDYQLGTHSVPVIYAISPSFLPRPAEWGDRIYMSGFWFEEHPEPWQPAENLESFLDAGSPVVYIGFGSMNSGDMNRLLTILIRAVRAANVRAVISLGWIGRQLKSTSRIMFVNEYVPHDWLFPRVDAVIHHGGAGTTSAGLKYGKPTLIIPFAGDQPFWGDRICRNGCGPKPLPRENLTIRKLVSAILDLLSQNKYSENARAMAEKMKNEHGVRNAADIIEKEITAW